DGGGLDAGHDADGGEGNLDTQQSRQPAQPEHEGHLEESAVDAHESRIGTAHHGEERVERQGDQRGELADAEERDHEDQKSESGNGLEHADGAELDLPRLAEVRRRDAKGHADHDGHRERDQDEEEMIEGEGVELAAEPTPPSSHGSLSS